MYSKIAKKFNLNTIGLSDDTIEICILECIDKCLKNRLNRIHKINMYKDRNSTYDGLYIIDIDIKIADDIFKTHNTVDIYTLTDESRIKSYIDYTKRRIKNELIESHDILLNKEETDKITNYIIASITTLLGKKS